MQILFKKNKKLFYEKKKELAWKKLDNLLQKKTLNKILIGKKLMVLRLEMLKNTIFLEKNFELNKNSKKTWGIVQKNKILANLNITEKKILQF